MDSKLLLKFIGYFPDYLLALSRTFYPFFGPTFVETAVLDRYILYLYTFAESNVKLGSDTLAKFLNGTVYYLMVHNVEYLTDPEWVFVCWTILKMARCLRNLF